MKKFHKIAVAGAAVLVLSAVTVTAFAASSYSTPAEAVAGLTGRSVESVIEERTESGKTYGTIADEAGKLEEFQTEMDGIREAALQERVAAGTLTQERADAILAAMEAHESDCDGTGSGGTGQGLGSGAGIGFGSGTRGAGSGYRTGTHANGLGTCADA